MIAEEESNSSRSFRSGETLYSECRSLPKNNEWLTLFDKLDSENIGHIPILDLKNKLKTFQANSSCLTHNSTLSSISTTHLKRLNEMGKANPNTFLNVNEFSEIMNSICRKSSDSLESWTRSKSCCLFLCRFFVGDMLRCKLNRSTPPFIKNFCSALPSFCPTVSIILSISFLLVNLCVYNSSCYNSLVYDATRRAEFWRYITYIFCYHTALKTKNSIPLLLSYIFYLSSTLLIFLFAAIPLEIISHFGSAKLSCLVLLSALTGSLFSSFFTPYKSVASFSAVNFAILTTYISYAMIHWKSSIFSFSSILRISFLSLTYMLHLCVSIYTFSTTADVFFPYALFVAGLFIGVFVGIPLFTGEVFNHTNIAKTSQPTSYKKKSIHIFLFIIAVMIILSLIVYNILSSHFPEQKIANIL